MKTIQIHNQAAGNFGNKGVSMRYVKLGFFLAVSSIPAFAGTSYSLVRISVSGVNQPNNSVIRCVLKPGLAVHQTEVAGLKGQVSMAWTADDARIQSLIDSVAGVKDPDSSNETGYTKWWAFASDGSSPKLLRATVNYPNNHLNVEDQSEAAKQLAVFTGESCLRSFGQ